MNIGHAALGIADKGGMAEYIQRVASCQRQAGHNVFFISNSPYENPTIERLIFADATDIQTVARDLSLNILHAHSEGDYPAHGVVPMIRTVHTHQPYCPRGSRFHVVSQKPCDLNYSVAGCILHAVTERCLSLRPNRLAASFRATQWDMKALRRMPSIAITQFIKDQMVRAGYPEDKIRVIYHAAPGSHLFSPIPRSDNVRLLFLGRLVQTKGVEWLLRSLAVTTAPFHLDIVGEGNCRQQFEQIATELHVCDKVTFHGWMDHETSMQFVARSRALVMPAIWHEPAGLVALEAMGQGRPCIISRTGGTPEMVVDGRCGVVVEPNDVVGLAAAMDCLASNIDLAEKLGQQGYDDVMNLYNMDIHMSQLMQAYDECIAEFKPS